MFATRAFPRMAQVFPCFTVCTLAKIRGSMPNRQRPCAKPPQQNSHLHQLCENDSCCDKTLPTVAFSHRQWTMELLNCPLFGFGPAQNETGGRLGERSPSCTAAPTTAILQSSNHKFHLGQYMWLRLCTSANWHMCVFVDICAVAGFHLSFLDPDRDMVNRIYNRGSSRHDPFFSPTKL